VDREKASKRFFTERTWVIETLVLIQFVDGIHFLFRQLKVTEGDIFSKSENPGRFGYDCCTALNSPSQNDLCGSAAMSGCDVEDRRMAQDRFRFGRHSDGNVGRSAQG